MTVPGCGEGDGALVLRNRGTGAFRRRRLRPMWRQCRTRRLGAPPPERL